MNISIIIAAVVFVVARATFFRQPGLYGSPLGAIDENTAAALWSVASLILSEVIKAFPQIREWISKLLPGVSPANGGYTEADRKRDEEDHETLKEIRPIIKSWKE